MTHDPKSTYTPMVIEKEGHSERAYDLPSRLLKDRIIILNGEVNNASVSSLIMQLLVLNADDSEGDIMFYINSGGGSVVDGLALFDTMQAVPNDIVTICVGQAASMGSFLLSAGAKGKRFSLPNSRLMYHQIMSGISPGTRVDDMRIAQNETDKLHLKMNTYLSEFTNGKINVKDMTEKTQRDWWLSPEEAIEQGFIDRVITKLNEF